MLTPPVVFASRTRKCLRNLLPMKPDRPNRRRRNRSPKIFLRLNPDRNANNANRNVTAALNAVPNHSVRSSG